MAEPRDLEITLRLELDRHPIAGSIGVPGREAVAFSGWLELASAIERSRAAPTSIAGKANPSRGDDGPEPGD